MPVATKISRICLLLVFLIPGRIIAQNPERLDCTSDSCRSRKMLDMAFARSESNPDTAILLSKQSQAFTPEPDPGYYRSLQIIGICHDLKGQTDSAIHYLQTALQGYIRLKLPEKQSHVLNDIALAWYFSGNYELALRNHFKALDLRKKIGEKKYIAMSLHNIGIVYRSRKDYRNALEYYKNSLEIKRELNNLPGVLNTTINLGSVYQNLGQYDSALYYANLALQLSQDLKSPNDVFIAQSNIATALLSQGKINEAQSVIITCGADTNAHPNAQMLLTYYAAQGEIYERTGRPEKAIAEYNKALKTSIETHRVENIAIYHKRLSEIYRKQGQLSDAYTHAQLYALYKDTLFNTENERQIAEMQVLYETKEKENKITELNFQNTITRKENLRSKEERNIFITFSILLLMVVIALIVLLRMTIKQRKQLSRQKQIIESSLHEKELLIREVHHRVKNNLQMVSSLLSLQSRQVQDDHAKSALNESKLRVQALGLIHQHLYGESIQTGVPIKVYLRELMEGLTNTSGKKISYTLTAPELILDIDTIIPLGLIINELVTNSLKHAFEQTEGGQIQLKIHEYEGVLSVHYSDNGKGKQHNEEENNTSFGMQMIQLFSKKLSATFVAEYSNGMNATLDIRQYKVVTA